MAARGMMKSSSLSPAPGLYFVFLPSVTGHISVVARLLQYPPALPSPPLLPARVLRGLRLSPTGSIAARKKLSRRVQCSKLLHDRLQPEVAVGHAQTLRGEPRVLKRSSRPPLFAQLGPPSPVLFHHVQFSTNK